MKKWILLIIGFSLLSALRAETGYELWLRYTPVKNKQLATSYTTTFNAIVLQGIGSASPIIRDELSRAWKGLFGIAPRFIDQAQQQGSLVIGTPASSPIIRDANIDKDLEKTGAEGFVILSKTVKGKTLTIIAANNETPLLYGMFHLLRLLQTAKPVHALTIVSTPRTQLRMLNHWDNLNRTVERGYAGFSIWNWHTLPGFIDQRYLDYARACASVGINASVLTNVNANATILTRDYLVKVKALADAFRPYGIKVFLTARFSAPIEIGKLKTADPLDPLVQQWWKDKVKEIYSHIPDFGGFLIKANSEGQPGPQDYKRTHADGANMFADALEPYKGIVIWRAFVYSDENPDDRHKQAYSDFVPLDGSFRKNVMVQVKNGAIDFMPREPFHPLFGAMPKTPLMMEFQITQEYLGQATNLVYLSPMFKETLDSDTYQKGKGTYVSKIIDGTADQHALTGMAGVANIGNDINWTGHPFAQSNWYAFGRLAWDHTLSSEAIAEEWLQMTFSLDPAFLSPARKLMMESRDIMVQFSNPIGLHHIMGTGHHYGPAPWVSNLQRPEWNPVYYHKADSIGIGFNRTASGSNALSQYHPDARKLWENMDECEERNLLWFHHVPWNYTMKSGRTLWNELCHQYYTGVEQVKKMQETWDRLSPYVDKERYQNVKQRLQLQYDEAVWWRNACLLYFQTFSKQPIPAMYEQPDKTLDYYKSLRFPFAPGNGTN